MDVKKPIFNPEIGYGHLLIIATWLVSCATGIAWVSSQYTEVKLEIAVINNDRAKYVPVVEATASAQLILTQRTEANSDTIRLLREQLQNVQQVGTATGKDVATLLARSENWNNTHNTKGPNQ